MPDNRPRGREKNVTGGTGSVNRRGDGLGSGPVGATGGHAGGQSSSGGGPSRVVRRSGGGLGIIVIIVILYFLFGRNGSSDSSYYTDDSGYSGTGQSTVTNDLTPYTGAGSSQNTSTSSLISALTTGSYGSSDIYTSSAYSSQSSSIPSSGNNSSVDTSVSSGARDKRTVIRGDGSDVVTIMVYMCGTDLESKSGMASNDLAEMAQATLSDNVNIIVYTGGCKAWKTSGISSKVNQIYQLTNGGMKRLVEDDGSKSMTDPATLSSFIKYCAANFPANRNELIFWDHGGGSVSGYGYDEKNAYGGSMDLAQIKKALTDGGVTFDFIGFDACLMATAETAIMLDDYADYLIASEETEPGIGWYYTNWLTSLSRDTGMSTLEVGKNIIDDFTNACAYKCNGQKTTLSIIDLAEFADTVPDKLSAFSKSVSGLIAEDYRQVSDARYQTREFATSSRIDQVDLVDLARKINTSEGLALAEAVSATVKYNRTSSNMTNAYGVSIYFPYQKRGYVDQAVATYRQIGMDDDYLRCIQDAAAMQTGGQAASGTGFDLFSSLMGSGSSSYSYSGGSSDLVGSLLGSFLGGRSLPSDDELDRSNTQFYDDKSFSDEEAAEYISMNLFDASNLFWSDGENGEHIIKLSENQWELVHDIDLNMFYDDGEGYIELGLDNVFDYTDDGDLIADTSGTWLAINSQVVPYYHTDTTESGDDYTITGYVPVLLNGERARLNIVFDSANPYGYIVGATTDYVDGETETVSKTTTGLNVGDTLDFVCDYYTYDFEYSDSYMIGEQIIVDEDLTISDIQLDDAGKIITYRFTDIYDRAYWTPMLELD